MNLSTLRDSYYTCFHIPFLSSGHSIVRGGLHTKGMMEGGGRSYLLVLFLGKDMGGRFLGWRAKWYECWQACTGNRGWGKGGRQPVQARGSLDVSLPGKFST